MNPPQADKRLPLPLRLAVYFATAPGEELTPADIAVKFGCSTQAPYWRQNLLLALRPSVQIGLLVYEPTNPGRKQPMVYRAGPALKQLLGLVPSPQNNGPATLTTMQVM